MHDAHKAQQCDADERSVANSSHNVTDDDDQKIFF